MLLNDEQMIFQKKWRSQKGRNQYGGGILHFSPVQDLSASTSRELDELDLGSQLNSPQMVI